MSVPKKSQTKSPKSGKYQPLTIGDVEKQSGTKLGVPPNTKATTYLNDSGLPSLGRVLQRVEHKLAHNN